MPSPALGKRKWTRSTSPASDFQTVTQESREVRPRPHVLHHIPEKLDIRVVKEEVCMMSLQDECRSQNRPELHVSAFLGSVSNAHAKLAVCYPIPAMLCCHIPRVETQKWGMRNQEHCHQRALAPAGLLSIFPGWGGGAFISTRRLSDTTGT